MATTPAGTSLPLRGVVGGVALLAVVGGFAIGLPKVDSGPDGGASVAALPDSLPSGLVAVDTLQSGPFVSQIDVVALRDVEVRAVSALDDFYDSSSAYRLYGRADGSALGAVTVIGRAPGPFPGDALPIAATDPASTARPSALVQRVGAAICEITWGQAVPAGQTPDPTQLPQQVRCQQGTDQTVQFSVAGLTLAEVEQVLAALPGGEESAQDQ